MKSEYKCPLNPIKRKSSENAHNPAARGERQRMRCFSLAYNHSSAIENTMYGRAFSIVSLANVVVAVLCDDAVYSFCVGCFACSVCNKDYVESMMPYICCLL